jgi:restriction endonuclease S subunit
MGDIPWITGADIIDDRVQSPRYYITEKAVQESATNIVPAGNILLVTRTGVGKVAITEQDICISQDFTGLIIDSKKIDKKIPLSLFA